MVVEELGRLWKVELSCHRPSQLVEQEYYLKRFPIDGDVLKTQRAEAERESVSTQNECTEGWSVLFLHEFCEPNVAHEDTAWHG